MVTVGVDKSSLHKRVGLTGRLGWLCMMIAVDSRLVLNCRVNFRNTFPFPFTFIVVVIIIIIITTICRAPLTDKIRPAVHYSVNRT